MMMARRLQTKDMLSMQYSLQSVSVEWIRPKAATKLAVIDARMARVRRDIRELTERLKRASATNRKAA